MLDQDKLIYFRDVYDHYVRVTDIAENLRESGVQRAGHAPVGGQQPHERGDETLTVITVLFAPITFISGFFGMNFFQASACSACGLAGQRWRRPC